MISFENTEIAFRSKSDADLNRAYWLFKIIGSPNMVRFGKWATNSALNIGLPIKGMIKKTIFTQFCGGEDIEECKKTIAELGKYHIGTILDYSVEGKTTEKEFDETVDEIIRTIIAGKNDPFNIPFAVFKVTGIARFEILEKANDEQAVLSDSEKQELQKAWNRVEKICRAAFDNDVPTLVDAEETWIQDTIDRMALDMMKKFNREKAIIYNTIQMYRHDRYDFLVNEIELAKAGNYHYGVKLVRGAYMEKERDRALQMGYPSPIQPDKAATDADYNKALKLILENINILALCAGSHNEDSSFLLSQMLKDYGISESDKRVFFGQLLGMSDHISYNLADAGFNIVKYVPYGPVKEVMPYLLRRADENTSVAGQTSRELALLMKERNRRKNKK